MSSATRLARPHALGALNVEANEDGLGRLADDDTISALFAVNVVVLGLQRHVLGAADADARRSEVVEVAEAGDNVLDLLVADLCQSCHRARPPGRVVPWSRTFRLVDLAQTLPPAAWPRMAACAIFPVPTRFEST
jgi:hypothetical protein